MFDLATVHGEHYKVLTPGIIVRDLWQGVQQAIVPNLVLSQQSPKLLSSLCAY